jgi:hypothetical protein
MAVYRKYIKIKDPSRLVLTDLPFRTGHVVEVVITDRTDGDGAPDGQANDRRSLIDAIGGLLSATINMVTGLVCR